MPRTKFAEMSAEELKREVLRRQRTLPQLIARRQALDIRRKALDKQIAELKGLVEILAAPKPASGEPGEKCARKARGRMKAGSLADKLAEVFEGEKSPSVPEEILLKDNDRFRAALGVFRTEPALKPSDETGGDRAATSVDKQAPAVENDKARAALSAEKERPKLRLADEDRASPAADQDDPKLHLADENGKFVWRTNVIL